MARISTRRRAHRPARTPAQTSHFTRLGRAADGHPIDIAVARRVQHAAQRKEMVRLQDQLLAKLGKNAKTVFLDLADLRSCMAAELQEAYFDVGYEYGLAERRTRGFRGVAQTSAVAAEICERVIRGRFPPRTAALALIERLRALISRAGDQIAHARRSVVPAGSR